MEGVPCKNDGCPNVAFDSSPTFPFCGSCANARLAEERARVTIKPVREGAMAMLPSSDGAGVSRRPAPFDGLLITSNGWSAFVDAGRLERELRRIGRAGVTGIPKRKERRVS